MNQQTTHLSEEDFCDLLTGDAVLPDAETHLAACAPCRREFEEVRAATDAFNRLTLAWAQLEAPRRVHPPSRFSRFLGGRPAWGLGVAATVATCTVAMVLGAPAGRLTQPMATPMAASSPSVSELAQDDQLMQSINQELRYDGPPAFGASDLRTPAHHDLQPAPSTMSR